ncbi:MAG: hypothetical protein ACFFKA_17965 [Candidatus Thorarchaeota archaeon]
MKQITLSKDELDDLLLNRIPKTGICQLEKIFCLATVSAYFRKRRHEKKAKK